MVLSKIKDKLNPYTMSIVKQLSQMGLYPWHLSFLSIIFALSSLSVLYYYEHPSLYTLMAVLLFLLAGLMDALDGALARYRDMVTSWGAFYDSFIDRTVEIIFIFGLLISALISSIPAYLYIVTSILISYSRARAEGLGISLSGIGIMERAERIIILSLFIVLYIFVPFNLDLIIYILVLINSITIIQRIYKVYTKSRSRYD